MRKWIFLTLALFTTISFNVISDESIQKLTLNSIVSSPFHTSKKDGCFDVFYEKLFAELDIQIDMVEYPAKRALQLVNQGDIDGDISRFSGFENEYTNLLRVPFPIYRSKLVLVSNTKIIDSVDSILQKEKIGIVLTAGLIHQWIPEKNQIITRDFKQLLNLLKSGRIHYIFLPVDILYGFERNVESNLNVKFSEENTSFDVFLFLHKKHKNLIPKLLNVIKREEYSSKGLSNACSEFRHIVKQKYPN